MRKQFLKTERTEHSVWHLVNLQEMLVTGVTDSVRFLLAPYALSTMIEGSYFKTYYIYCHYQLLCFPIGSCFSTGTNYF